MSKAWADLLMDNGEIVQIEYDKKYEDEVLEMIDNCRKRGDWWAPGSYEGTSAMYMGINLDRVNMQRVVGML